MPRSSHAAATFADSTLNVWHASDNLDNAIDPIFLDHGEAVFDTAFVRRHDRAVDLR